MPKTTFTKSEYGLTLELGEKHYFVLNFAWPITKNKETGRWNFYFNPIAFKLHRSQYTNEFDICFMNFGVWYIHYHHELPPFGWEKDITHEE